MKQMFANGKTRCLGCLSGVRSTPVTGMHLTVPPKSYNMSPNFATFKLAIVQWMSVAELLDTVLR